jgi:hypothetical protein
MELCGSFLGSSHQEVLASYSRKGFSVACLELIDSELLAVGFGQSSAKRPISPVMRCGV